MKRMVCYGLSIVILLITSNSFAARPAGLSKLEFPFSSFNNQPVSVLLELDTGRVIMMIPCSGSRSPELTYMANAVQEMVSSRNPVPLSDGYTLEFGTGFPIWGPHSESGPNYEYTCLLFAESTTINGKRIVVNGSSSRQPFDGYAWWLNRE